MKAWTRKTPNCHRKTNGQPESAFTAGVEVSATFLETTSWICSEPSYALADPKVDSPESAVVEPRGRRQQVNLVACFAKLSKAWRCLSLLHGDGFAIALGLRLPDLAHDGYCRLSTCTIGRYLQNLRRKKPKILTASVTATNWSPSLPSGRRPCITGTSPKYPRPRHFSKCKSCIGQAWVAFSAHPITHCMKDLSSFWGGGFL